MFQVRPGQEVFVNQNPGSWWRVNGHRAFADRRCAEPMLPFVARADDTGRLELRIDPPGLRIGIALHIIGAALLAAAWGFGIGIHGFGASAGCAGPRREDGRAEAAG